jgi:hypothetical protein
MLCSPNAFYMGKSIDIVLNNIILNEDFIGIDNLLVCDKQAIILYLRSTSFGDEYPLKFECPKCHKENEKDFKISELEINDLDYLPKEDGFYEYTLLKMRLSGEKVKIKFSPLTVKQQNELTYQNEINKNSEVTLMYTMKIHSINDIKDKRYINSVVSNMPITDSEKFRDYINKVEPKIKNEIQFDCEFCHYSFMQNLDFNDQFLGVTPEYRKQLLDEIFNISYYHKGGLPRNHILDMPTADRRWELQRIVKEVDKQNKEIERSQKK